MDAFKDFHGQVWLQAVLENGFMERIHELGIPSGLAGSCTTQIIATVLHLTLFGSFFITFIWRRIGGWLRSSSSQAAADKVDACENKRKDTVVKSRLIFKASLSCCCLLTASCFLLMLYDLYRGAHPRCNWRASFIVQDIALLLAWAFMAAVVFNFRRSLRMRLPILLRIWWIASFFQSLISTLSDMDFQMKNRAFLPHVLADSFNLLLSLILLYVAVKGYTGVHCSHSALEEPLLAEDSSRLKKADKREYESESKSAYGSSNLFGRLTFSWLNPLFPIGIAKTLELDDVPRVAKEDSAAEVYRSIEEKLNALKQSDSANTSIPVPRAIVNFIWKKAALNAMFAVTNACASFVGPYLIRDFVSYLNTKDEASPRKGYVLACVFFGAKVIETVSQRQWIFGARQLGMRLRAALTAQIYRKGLHLSNQSRQSHTSGEIINYMSVDVQRIGDFAWYLNTIWMLPIQLILAIAILYQALGSAAFAAFVATFAVMAVNLPLTRKQKYFQSKIMESKDKRMKATSEILKNMKILKLQAWEMRYLQRLEELRMIEYNWLGKSLRLQATTTFIFWGAPALISAITFAVSVMMGIPLTSGGVLSALATFRILQEPIYSLPDLLSILAQAKVSLDRVTAYLQEEELNSGAVEKLPFSSLAEFAFQIEGGEFSWDLTSAQSTLKNLNLEVKRGMKVAVCGTVGAGKSSLLSCLLGEIPKIRGSVKVSGSKAYVAQSPWIQTGTIRDNILFGRTFDRDTYERILHACALNKDLELLPHGDQTEIGERGINMSGGQKQRIQLARAMYQDADIYLLDDPFSAVDAHTGTHLFQECLMRVLTGKTVIYVTHQIEFLPSADLILVIKDGMIVQAGKYDMLLQSGTGFETLVTAHNEALQTVVAAENQSGIPVQNERCNAELVNLDQLNGKVKILRTQNSGNQMCSAIQQEPNVDAKYKHSQLVQEEERESGSISKKVYWHYLTAVYGGALVPIILGSQSLFQVLQIASNYWMAWACPASSDAQPIVGLPLLILVYTALSIVSAICVLIRALLVATVGLLTSQRLFLRMLHSIFHAPMSFFDMTPSGRILNRASTDQSIVDLEIAVRLGWVAFSVIQLIGTIIVMSQVAWQVFAIFIPVTAVCIWYQQYYIPTARELARLVGTQRAPILHHFSETLSGVATVRAFEQEPRFIETNLSLIDNHSKPWFHNISAMEWLSFRLNLLSTFVFAFSLIVVVSLPEGMIDPGFAGLAVTYGLNLNVLLATIIWNLCNAEIKMISVERIIQYSGISSESPLVVEDYRPPQEWPYTGTISLNNLQIRYAKHFPLVLRNLTCTFPGRSKTGVVGRTGSGKSTLIQALFRIVEPAEGKILIDGLDICLIGLHDLRSKLSIIPQEPAMFEGTVRANLDPLEEYSDLEIWQALDKCQLGDVVRAKEGKLSSPVIENGENWSVGQRQLVCLGRVLLKKSKILVLDEATASVDTATDSVIQRIIRSEFSHCTVITIAHRIHSVVDSDLVLLLGEGRIMEYDSPSNLLEDKNSSFSKLIQEYSMRSCATSTNQSKII